MLYYLLMWVLDTPNMGEVPEQQQQQQQQRELNFLFKRNDSPPPSPALLFCVGNSFN